jgi:hypothetical protein
LLLALEAIDKGRILLVRVAKNWKEAADILLQDLDNPRSHKEVLEETITYVKDRQGGTDKACRQITAFLNNT